MDLLGTLQHVLNTLGFHQSITAFLVVFGLCFARIVSAISLVPFLGGSSVATNIKVGLAVVITALIFPSLPDREAPPSSVLVILALLVKETMIGVIIGFVTQLLLYAVQMAGALIDNQRGMDQPGMHAPQLPGNVSLLGQLQFQVALVIFLFLNGHLIFLQALARSFGSIPVLGFPRLAEPVTLAQQFAQMSGQIFVVALQLGGPILLTLFLVDVLFGAIGKLAPQVNVNQESQPVKCLIGLVILVPAIGFIFARLDGVLSLMMWDIYRILERIA